MVEIAFDATSSVTFDPINRENVMVEVTDKEGNRHIIWVKHRFASDEVEKIQHAVWDAYGEFLDKDDYEVWDDIPTWLSSCVSHVTKCHKNRDDITSLKYYVEGIQTIVNNTFCK